MAMTSSDVRTAGAAFEIRPLSTNMAAEVIGLDISQTMDQTTRDAVYDAFLQHKLLCFRNQSLTQDQQVAFSEQFGTLERHAVSNRNNTGGNSLVHIVSNLGPDGKPSGTVKSTKWHSDKSFRPEPSMATILHAVTLPPNGGDTCFADMAAAYSALDESTKKELDGVKVVHSWELSRENIGKQLSAEEIADAPPQSHPLARPHPDTAAKALFMGMHASHLEGAAMDAGRACIIALEEHATQDQFVYRHTWSQGDVLMWDNRCLLHRADPNFDAANFPRVMHRTCLRGTPTH